jgi:phosphohistidine swiveling domain-containing protein
MNNTHVCPFTDQDNALAADLDTVGGKGLSLASMTAAGFAVPAGFTVTTAAYRQFVSDNGLQEAIIAGAKPGLVGTAVSFDSASERIQALFAEAELTDELKAQIAEAYAAFGGGEPPVAVRSSANAEDLPNLSFAGQQDTYLNIRGRDAVYASVRDCWASLWTARALSYRHEHAIAQEVVAMAVVVQVMVPSEVSGILFTANPATGERSEMIVNASYGLGEAIVGGEITPDTYIIDRETMAVRETLIGSKEHMLVSAAGQGTDTRKLSATEREQSSLAEPVLRELAQLASAVEQHFGQPQDIEWAVVNGTLSLLQSRPITNLPPAPLKDIRWEKPDMPDWVFDIPLLRKNLVEHIPGPVSPLFEDLYLKDAVGGRAGNSVHYAVNGYAYWTVGTPPGVEPLPTSGLFPGSAKEQSATLKNTRLFKTPPKQVGNHSYGTGNWAKVYTKRFDSWRKETLPAYLAVIDELRQLDPQAASDEALLDGVRALATADGETWYSPAMRLESIVSHVGTMIVMNMLRGAETTFQDFLQKAAPGKGFSSGQFLSGLRSVSMEAQDEISDIAELIRADDGLVELVLTTPAPRLLPALRERSEAALIVQAIDQHLARYGHQISTLDFAEPTLAEDPSPIMLNLKAVVQDSDHDPAATQIDIARRRQTALREAKQTFSAEDWRELCDFLWLMKRVYPDRDQALFYLGAGWPTLRRLALELGSRLVEAGTLTRPDDLFYLWKAQLEEAMAARQAGKALPELKERVAEQRELQQTRLRLLPPDAVPPEEGWGPGWGKTANDADSDSLNGNACSPGQITARASLVLSPADFAKMQPGTILVCPMTTPAWTQLFSQAKGLVTDIGSILTHGSIVAREYNIPAVLGVGIATKRIRHGQLIRVDGDHGVVVLLDE